MAKHSPNAQNDFMEEKRKLMYWFARWTDEEAQFDNIPFDIAEMSVLLQSIGFRLDTFEKVFDSENIPILQTSANMADRNMMRIDLTCPKSGMRSSLIKQTPTCKCPSEEALDKGEFWTVTGCGPSSQSSINTSNSSLLPTITPAKTKIVKGLLSKVLMVICSTDVEENGDIFKPTHNLSLLTRHRSLDTLKKCEDSSFNSRGLKRRPSWEVDPKTSPPTQTSSPLLPSLCSTMSKISIDSGNSNTTIIKNLENVKKLIEDTLVIASENNATFVKSGVPKKRVSDIKPSEGPSVRELKLSTPPTTISRRVFTPRKILTPREKKDLMAPPSKIGMFRKKTISAGVSPKTTLLRTDTPRPKNPLLLQSQGTSKSCENIVKSKIATVRAAASPRYNRPNEAGASGIARFKTVGKMTLNAITPAKKK